MLNGATERFWGSTQLRTLALSLISNIHLRKWFCHSEIAGWWWYLVQYRAITVCLVIIGSHLYLGCALPHGIVANMAVWTCQSSKLSSRMGRLRFSGFYRDQFTSKHWVRDDIPLKSMKARSLPNSQYIFWTIFSTRLLPCSQDEAKQNLKYETRQEGFSLDFLSFPSPNSTYSISNFLLDVLFTIQKLIHK